MKKMIRPILITGGVLLFTIILFCFTYLFDNKYTIKMPFPQDGVLSVTAEDLSSPVFLIDQWQISDGVLSPSQWETSAARRTYVGEFSNFRQNNASRSPLGAATYQIRLHYTGEPIVAALELPELFFDYRLWLDDTLLSEGSGTAGSSFILREGDHTLTVSTQAEHGYYAGMYYPGSIGTPDALQHREQIRSFCYALAFLAPLVLALFCLFLWKVTGSGLRGKFALLCLSFSAYVSYYFVQLWSLPFARYWYLVEDVAFYAFLYFAVALSLEAAGINKQKWSRVPAALAIVIPAAEVLLYFLTPVWGGSAALHSGLQDAYRILIFLCLVLCSAKIITTAEKERRWILAANTIFGVSILINLIFSNLFEPIYTFWQMEWCGLLLVALFAGLMVAQNKRILMENARYQTQLEQMVEERTRQLSCLLEERRAFFSDMAHDLKAPLFATNTFIQMIRQHSVGLDDQLLYYIGQVEQKQGEMSRRVQSLNALNAVDKLNEPARKIDVRELLVEIYQMHNPEAAVSGVHLIVPIPPEPLFIRAQQEKLMVVFENLIYNALRFTLPGGAITLSCEKEQDFVRFTVADTGCGIPAAELPHVFDRFFIGEAGNSSGSGLGLYIVKSIVEEADGTVSVDSGDGTGAVFSFTIPVG